MKPQTPPAIATARTVLETPEDDESSDRCVAPPSPALESHAGVLHAREEVPVQRAPPLLGAGLVHVRVCVPPPQVTEQAVQPDHPPGKQLSSRSERATQAKAT